MLDRFVVQLGKELEMEDQIVSIDPPTHYKLPFVDEIDVNVTQTTNSYYFKGILGPYPQKQSEEFLIKLMEANLFGKGTYGAVIGLQEDEKLLTLSLEIDYNSNYKEWKEKLQDFISVMDYWKKEAGTYSINN